MERVNKLAAEANELIDRHVDEGMSRDGALNVVLGVCVGQVSRMSGAEAAKKKLQQLIDLTPTEEPIRH